MKRILFTLCAAAMATVSMAATIDLKPADLHRVRPSADSELIFTPLPEGFALEAPQRAYSKVAGTSEKIDFTMAFDPYGAFNLGKAAVGLEIYQAFEVSPELATLYAGATIKSVNVTSGYNGSTGENSLTSVNVYLMDDLDSKPFLSQKGTIGTGKFSTYRVNLTRPYTIEAGKGFFVAYSVTPISDKDAYIVGDGVPRFSSEGCYVGAKQGGTITWNEYVSQIGNLCMGITLESENLPSNGVELFGAITPDFVSPGKEFSTEMLLIGGAYNDAESIEVEYTVGSSAPKTTTLTFDTPLGYRKVMSGYLEGMVCDQTGIDVPVSIKITKVNGEPNIAITDSFSTTVTCFNPEDGFKRTILVEEGTGTWCGYCPAGMVYMDYLKTKYPDDCVLVAMHASSVSTQDPMQVNSCAPLLGLFEGFPQVFINRTHSVYPTAEGVLDDADEIFAAATGMPAVGEISSINIEFDEEDVVNVSAKARFAIDMANDNRYGVSFCLTQDGMGPYMQTNYYAGTSTSMGGWEYRSEQVATVYDDVLRDLIGGLTGYTAIFPAEIKAHEEYECKDEVFLENVSNANFHVAAILTDNLTGEVMNVKQIDVENPYWAGVGTVGSDAAAVVKGAEGKIMILGDYNEATVCDFGGMQLARANGESEICVPAGLYIVSIDGRAVKVAVR